MRVLLVFALICPPAFSMPMSVKIVACESSGRPAVWGDDHTSYGIAQFQSETFSRFKQEMGRHDLQWRNPLHQLEVLNWALSNGYGNHWTCYRKIKSGQWRITPELTRKMRRNLWIKIFYKEHGHVF